MTYNRYSSAVKKYYKNKNSDFIIFSWNGINDPGDIRIDLIDLINNKTYSEVIKSMVIHKEKPQKVIFLEIPNNQTILQKDDSSIKITELLRQEYSKEHNNIEEKLTNLEVQLNNYESPYLKELKDYFKIKELTKKEYYFE